MRIQLLVFMVLFLFVRCKKEEDRNCIKSIGEISSKEVSLQNFTQLYMGPHIKYVLVQDSTDKVVIIGGYNLLNGIDVSLDDQILSIENLNKCAFLRTYDEVVQVEIHFTQLTEIEFEGTHEVVCTDTIQAVNLELLIREGAGHFDLKLNANSLNLVVAQGWGNYSVSGNVNFANLRVSGNGFGNSNNLNVTNELVVISNTVGLVELNADQCVLLAEIRSSGSIYYKGTPGQIELNRYGTGELIDKN